MCLEAAACTAAASSVFPGVVRRDGPRNRNVDEQADLLEDRGHR